MISGWRYVLVNTSSIQCLQDQVLPRRAWQLERERGMGRICLRVFTIGKIGRRDIKWDKARFCINVLLPLSVRKHRIRCFVIENVDSERVWWAPVFGIAAVDRTLIRRASFVTRRCVAVNISRSLKLSVARKVGGYWQCLWFSYGSKQCKRM